MAKKSIYFSIGVPESVFIQLGELARKEKRTKNAVVNDLLLLGLGRLDDFDAAVRQFVFREVTQEEFARLQGNA